MSKQSHLVPDTTMGGRALELDFPSLHIGIAHYSEGPTGTTVFRFATKAVGCIDVRGGAPGTYNSDWLKLGYSAPNLDAVIISGGSWYGLAAAGGAAAALKEDGVRSGHWSNLANVAGAIVYDLGERRPNEFHPDEKLGAAAMRAAKPGRFPMGAQGAGRMTMQGSYFGLWLHSGQGGAFRQIGSTKIACFVVANPVGTIVDRDGRLRFGNQRIATGETTIRELIGLVPEKLRTVAGGINGQRKTVRMSDANTTISLVVTNQKLDYAQLQRLAVQVHASMGRAIQPFATLNDGDVLFAASTCEVDNADLHPTDLGLVASELMWDAILNSVPDIDDAAARSGLIAPAESQSGAYRLDDRVEMAVEIGSNQARIRNSGDRDVFGIAPGHSLVGKPSGGAIFATDSPYLAEFGFAGGDGAPMLVLNPGPWQQVGRRK